MLGNDTMKSSEGFQIAFDNEVTVFVGWNSYEEMSAKVSASHKINGPVEVTGFEKMYNEDNVIPNLKSEDVVRFMDKASRMRFTEDGQKTISFFDF
jgi:hypothetical protein|tara:strand:- start:74834 stop:75121 length:288 start_codon:yes stop_codon:yes gene_type:complete